MPPLALSVTEYAAPVVPPLSGDVLPIASGPVIVSANVFDAVVLAVSVTCSVKLNVPVAVGVPLSTPAVENVMPAGSEPDVSAHV